MRGDGAGREHTETIHRPSRKAMEGFPHPSAAMIDSTGILHVEFSAVRGVESLDCLPIPLEVAAFNCPLRAGSQCPLMAPQLEYRQTLDLFSLTRNTARMGTAESDSKRPG